MKKSYSQERFNYEKIIISAKQRVYRIIAIICLIAIIASTLGSYYYDQQSLDIYLLTGLPAACVILLVLALLSKRSLILWVERICASAMVLYLFTWTIANLVSERLPTDHFEVNDTPVQAITIMFLSVVVPRKWVFRVILSFFCVHTCLVWINLFQFPWSQAHISQMTTDILMLCVVFTVSLLSTYSHTLFLAQVDTKNMYDLANTDMLTSLLNRRAMLNILQRRNLQIIIQVDIDHFKSINDNFGHDIGDKVLVRVAQLLQKGFAEYGLVSRWGGEEFMISIKPKHLDKVLNAAEQVRIDIEKEPFMRTVTISQGITQQRINEDINETIKRVDELLYAAKEGGRNCIHSCLNKPV